METIPNQRSTFLTVLCILSFINGGLNILFNIPSLLMPNFMETYIEIIKQTQSMNDYSNAPPALSGMMNDIMAMLERMSQHWTVMILSTILLATMSVIGVWMMWNVKKAGFLFYTTAQILWTLMPFVFMGVNWLSILAVGINAIFTAAFIIMYGTQLKKMN
ncbi:MAG: hypothetical protein HY063_12360 [Bacteroidetes bacterium]|nr:hypothetical protein [Bacteroidota bacterium]